MTLRRVVLATMLVLGCGDGLQPSTNLIVMARVLTPTLLARDTLRVRVVAINGTSNAITVTSPSTCHFYLYVYDSANAEVDHTRWMCGQAFTDLTIAAHDSAVEVIGMRIDAFDGTKLVPPAPGLYRVRAVLDVVPRPSRWSSSVPLRIE